MDVFFSDFDSYSESGSSNSDELDDNEFMYGGHASCILSNLQESIGKIDGFLTFERGYVHGDVVCSIGNPSGQTGKVINVEKVVDLENVDGKKLKTINSKKLKTVHSISIGDYVVSGHWLGKVERIIDRVTVLLDDGMKCEFSEMDDEKLVPLSSSSDWFHDLQFPYFPGQRVKVKHSFFFKSTTWFCGTENHKEHEGTVCAINAGFVFVKWLGCAPLASERAVPESFQNSESLTVLSGFTHSNWQLGDWCLLPKFQELFVISKTKSNVDVLWQDGSESFGLDSSSLNPVNIVDAHDFWPHQFVLEKGTSDDQESKKCGVVKFVNASEKTVNVIWEGNGIEETVSAYELIEHPEFSFSHGDVVYGLGLDKLCPFGTVMGFKDGKIEVKWATGFTSKVSPNAIFPIDKCEFVAGTQLPHNENIESNQEKSEHDVPATDPKAKDLMDVDGKEKYCFIPEAAFRFLSNFAASLFGSLAYTSLNSLPEEHRSNFDSQEKNAVSVQTYTENVTFSSSSKNHEKVDNFEMVKRSWLKKVQQEWSILMKDLPETIYVRVFEERMDLLQAAIIGAPGTPYHDGLFFFDIFLPPEYPQEPPMVHYVSGGLRVNPNLYESGRVCLSLLNTWTGTGSETWNPNGSTILQVVLSLQALVLNKDPYFNEAGYGQQVGSVEGEKNSSSYSENVFLVSCKSMIYTLRNPPKHFEALVEEHFKQRYTNILMACKAYMEGVPIGYPSGDIEHMGQTKSSTGFKITLSKLFSKLVEAFSAKGLDCGEYVKM